MKWSLNNCRLCPRNCGADRFSEHLGYCRTDAKFHIGSITVHKGEEPAISGKKGICNLFFSRCNLQCLYCQNYQISRNQGKIVDYPYELNHIIENIISILDTGIRAVGFVSPSHCMAQTQAIIQGLHDAGAKPIIVMNTNAYDKPEILRKFEGLADVWLPDFKYQDANLARDLSDAPNYPQIALNALKEMYYQKGSSLLCDDEGEAESGLIIRHLVLPGYVENSLAVLRCIAEEISTAVHLSLMAQYYPTSHVNNHPMLQRMLMPSEYDRVIQEMESLGFYNGWIQELESSHHYVPDFMKPNPFQ